MAITTQERETSRTWATRSWIFRSTLYVLAVAIVLVSLMAGWAYSRTGSAAFILRFLNGERLLVDSTKIWLGAVRKGTSPAFTIHVVNATGRDVRLVGAQRSCSCLTTDEFPLLIPNGQTQDLQLAIKVHHGEIGESVTFYTDYPDLRDFTVAVSGEGQ